MRSPEHYDRRLTRDHALHEYARLRELFDDADVKVATFHGKPSVELTVKHKEGKRLGDKNPVAIAWEIGRFLEAKLPELFLKWLRDQSEEIERAQHDDNLSTKAEARNHD